MTAPARDRISSARSAAASAARLYPQRSRGTPILRRRARCLASPARSPMRSSAVLVPAIASSRAATSATVRAIGPGESWLHEIGTTPSVGTSPTVGFSPTTPQQAAGEVIEPLVSVPTANAANRAATAAPLPELDPEAVRFSAYGLRVSPPWALQPEVEC